MTKYVATGTTCILTELLKAAMIEGAVIFVCAGFPTCVVLTYDKTLTINSHM